MVMQNQYSLYHQGQLLYHQVLLVGSFLIGVVLLPSQTLAQRDVASAADADLEMNGLVIDETITKIGRDFYELFYAHWEAPLSRVDYTLFIKEQPQPGRGTRITLLFNDTELMTQMIQPRPELLLAVASRAIQLAQYQIINYEQMSQQLENEDQYGSGIF